MSINVTSKITETQANFLRHYSQDRIRPSTLDFYDSLPSDPQVVVEAKNDGKIIALSVATIREGRCVYSVTAVHKDYRNTTTKHGTQVLKQKVTSLTAKGVEYVGQVASDHPEALAMVKAAGLISPLSPVLMERRDGMYFAQFFRMPKAAPAPTPAPANNDLKIAEAALTVAASGSTLKVSDWKRAAKGLLGIA